jgi:hypothetical protein
MPAARSRGVALLAAGPWLSRTSYISCSIKGTPNPIHPSLAQLVLVSPLSSLQQITSSTDFHAIGSSLLAYLRSGSGGFPEWFYRKGDQLLKMARTKSENAFHT